MVFENTAEWVAFGGALAGVVFRSVVPYFDKVQQMETNGEDPIAFLHKYKITAVISLAVAAVTAMSIFQGINTTQGGSLGALFIAAFTSGIGTNELLNRGASRASEKIAQVDKRAAQKQKAKQDKKELKSEAESGAGTTEEKSA